MDGLGELGGDVAICRCDTERHRQIDRFARCFDISARNAPTRAHEVSEADVGGLLRERLQPLARSLECNSVVIEVGVVHDRAQRRRVGQCDAGCGKNLHGHSRLESERATNPRDYAKRRNISHRLEGAQVNIDERRRRTTRSIASLHNEPKESLRAPEQLTAKHSMSGVLCMTTTLWRGGHG